MEMNGTSFEIDMLREEIFGEAKNIVIAFHLRSFVVVVVVAFRSNQQIHQ